MGTFSYLLKFPFKNNPYQLYNYWKVLKNGVCDGCALGAKGIFEGRNLHICHYRLRLLELQKLMPIKENTNLDLTYLKEFTKNHHPQDLGRLNHPSLLRGGIFSSISWDEAMEWIMEKITLYKPEQMAFIGSGRCGNEANYLLQKLARMLGTNNVDHCARY